MRVTQFLAFDSHMHTVSHDLAVLTAKLQDAVRFAGLGEFRSERGENGSTKISCEVSGLTVEVTFSPQPFGKDRIKIERIEVSDKSARPIVYVADTEAQEFFVQKVGVPFIERFEALSYAAGSKGLDFLGNAFNADSKVDTRKLISRTSNLLRQMMENVRFKENS